MQYIFHFVVIGLLVLIYLRLGEKIELNQEKQACIPLSQIDKTPVKIFHRYQKFNTVIFKNEQHYKKCKKHYEENFKGLSAKEIIYDGDIYDGIRFLNRHERERLQTVPEGYCDCLTDNETAGVLGDGWTVDVIAHILKNSLKD